MPTRRPKDYLGLVVDLGDGVTGRVVRAGFGDFDVKTERLGLVVVSQACAKLVEGQTFPPDWRAIADKLAEALDAVLPADDVESEQRLLEAGQLCDLLADGRTKGRCAADVHKFHAQFPLLAEGRDALDAYNQAKG